MAKTLLDLRTEIKEDLDMENTAPAGSAGNDPFIQDSEINRHINAAIKDAEAIIHNLYEDYFLTSAFIELVSGTALYDLPTDIFAYKIRRILYDDGSKSYRVDRITDLNEIPEVESTEDYRYMLINDSTNGIQIKLYPDATESSDENVTIWYIRRALELSADDDELDIPEFYNYIMADAKNRCLIKDPGNPIREEIRMQREEQRLLMINTLSNRTPDDQTDIKPDFSFYWDSIA